MIGTSIDLSIVYDFNEYPDKKSGRCDNCDNAHFSSSIVEGKLTRECRNCEMKKSI